MKEAEVVAQTQQRRHHSRHEVAPLGLNEQADYPDHSEAAAGSHPPARPFVDQDVGPKLFCQGDSLCLTCLQFQLKLLYAADVRGSADGCAANLVNTDRGKPFSWARKLLLYCWWNENDIEQL